ncbi:uncharacterized protein LOC123643902 isoform X3 [Lemur catta]|uniref:uncharacterized protein LOC123643902 isoform X3 n=1 Tax=Lemur catta TaxID=9447 RepID=UPI001E26DED4|nr:uncharacterized protein LOC123643902 isoform X3 [Lemur catta]
MWEPHISWFCPESRIRSGRSPRPHGVLSLHPTGKAAEKCGCENRSSSESQQAWSRRRRVLRPPGGWPGMPITAPASVPAEPPWVPPGPPSLLDRTLWRGHCDSWGWPARPRLTGESGGPEPFPSAGFFEPEAPPAAPAACQAVVRLQHKVQWELESPLAPPSWRGGSFLTPAHPVDPDRLTPPQLPLTSNLVWPGRVIFRRPRSAGAACESGAATSRGRCSVLLLRFAKSTASGCWSEERVTVLGATSHSACRLLSLSQSWSP